MLGTDYPASYQLAWKLFPNYRFILGLAQTRQAYTLFVFGVFTFLILWGKRKQYKLKNRRLKLTLTAFLSGVFYSAVTEWLQHFLPVGRHGNIYDFMANNFGSIFGVFVFHILFRKK